MKIIRRRLLCIALSIGLLTGLPVLSIGGGIYKWVDEDGVVHYGDKPKQNEVEEIKVDEAPPIDEEAALRLQEQRQQLLNRRHTIKRDGKDVNVSTQELDQHLRGRWNGMLDELRGSSTSGE